MAAALDKKAYKVLIERDVPAILLTDDFPETTFWWSVNIKNFFRAVRSINLISLLIDH